MSQPPCDRQLLTKVRYCKIVVKIGSMELFDTHCHIHSHDYGLEPDTVIEEAIAADVTRFICVGTDLEDSIRAVDFVQARYDCWASIGIHPHEAKDYTGNTRKLQKFRDIAGKAKVVAVGETGLDYYYNYSPKNDQEELLRFQIELALEHNLPLVFHVREAFDDFWRIYRDYSGVRGVIHSFTDSAATLDKILSHNLYVGLNGIVTFTGKAEQLDMARRVPLEKLILETDAPFLTPSPFRGTICQSKHVRVTAEFLASLRGENLEVVANSTTRNAMQLFSL